MKLELKGLTKKFGNFTAVDHVDLTMTNGVYGLLGVNGAGKTTLMRMMCTLLRPTDGSVLCNGKDIFEMDSRYRKLLGYLPQEFGYYPEFTAQDFLLYLAALKGLPRQQALTYAAQMVLGAAAMVLESGKHPGQLKDEVCSPGGSTIAGVAALEKNGFRSAAIQAVQAAYARNQELGKV